MIIGFKPQFEPKIKAKTKIHTIREDKTNRWKAGMAMHMATGVRTKNYRCFALDKCISTQQIKIVWQQRPCKRAAIYIDNMCVGTYTNGYASGLCHLIAKNDGFDCAGDFFRWFNEDFEGKIIHWTDKRY